MDEWKLFTLDSSVGNILSPADQSSVLQDKPRLDVLWSRVHQLQGPSRDLKYPLICKLTRACLALAHGNADTERFFSDGANIMRNHRTQLECLTLNALLSIRNYLHVNGLNCTTMTIDTNLLSLARDARKSYNERQMQQQRERESEQNSKKITDEIDALNKMIQTEKDKSNKLKSAKACASSASQKEQDAQKRRKEAVEMVERAQLLLKEAKKQGKEAARE